MIFFAAISLTAQAAGGAVILGTGTLLFILGLARHHLIARAGGLLMVLTGFFVALVSVLDRADPQESPIVSLGVFAGAVAVFRLMTRFEPGPEERARNP